MMCSSQPARDVVRAGYSWRGCVAAPDARSPQPHLRPRAFPAPLAHIQTDRDTVAILAANDMDHARSLLSWLRAAPPVVIPRALALTVLWMSHCTTWSDDMQGMLV